MADQAEQAERHRRIVAERVRDVVHKIAQPAEKAAAVKHASTRRSYTAGGGMAYECRGVPHCSAPGCERATVMCSIYGNHEQSIILNWSVFNSILNILYSLRVGNDATCAAWFSD